MPFDEMGNYVPPTLKPLPTVKAPDLTSRLPAGPELSSITGQLPPSRPGLTGLTSARTGARAPEIEAARPGAAAGTGLLPPTSFGEYLNTIPQDRLAQTTEYLNRKGFFNAGIRGIADVLATPPRQVPFSLAESFGGGLKAGLRGLDTERALAEIAEEKKVGAADRQLEAGLKMLQGEEAVQLLKDYRTPEEKQSEELKAYKTKTEAGLQLEEQYATATGKRKEEEKEKKISKAYDAFGALPEKPSRAQIAESRKLFADAGLSEDVFSQFAELSPADREKFKLRYKRFNDIAKSQSKLLTAQKSFSVQEKQKTDIQAKIAQLQGRIQMTQLYESEKRTGETLKKRDWLDEENLLDPAALADANKKLSGLKKVLADIEKSMSTNIKLIESISSRIGESQAGESMDYSDYSDAELEDLLGIK